MWRFPWGYKESFTVCAGLAAIGLVLQLATGKADLQGLAFPVNCFAGGGYLFLISVLFFGGRRKPLIRWVGGFPAAVSAMVSLVFLLLIMGMTRQYASVAELPGWQGRLGFSQMLSSWPFVLSMLWFMTVLWLVILNRLCSFGLKSIPFLLNHLGLFLALIGGVLGSADMQRLEMTATVGKPEWRGISAGGEVVELSLAVELNRFTIEEYPPKLMLLDNGTGKMLPEGKPFSLLLEEENTSTCLGEWRISTGKILPLAASVATEDTLRFTEFRSVGATTAVYVTARRKDTGEKREGWISCGSFMFPYKALRLDETVSLVMPPREPRRYASEVTVYTRSGNNTEALIEVNKPFRIEGWDIYQLSYDEGKGKWSDISVFELVRDPGLPVVYTGIWMMLAGAVCLFGIPKKRKEAIR